MTATGGGPRIRSEAQGAAASAPPIAFGEAEHQQLHRYRLLVEQSADVIVQTRFGIIEWVSPAVEREFGWRPEQLVGLDWTTLSHPEEADVVQVARTDEFRGTTNAARMRFRRLDGDWRWTDLNTTSVRDDEGLFHGVVVATVRNVHEAVQTEQRLHRVEAELRESQKLESLGLLAGGVAHDFNNILAVMLGNAELARDDLPETHPARLSLDRIDEAGERAETSSSSC